MDFAAGFNIFQEIGPNYLGGMLYGEGRTAIHMTHRMGALVTLLAVLWLAWRLYRAGLTATAAALTAALFIQLSLCITNILAQLPLAVAVAHNAFGAVLLLTLVFVNYQLRPVAIKMNRPSRNAVGHWTPG